MKIQIFGVGRLGSQIAFNCLVFIRPKELWLDDIKDLSGDILDLEHAKRGLNVKTKIQKGKARKPDIIIISAGFPRNTEDKEMNDIYYRNRQILNEILQKIPNRVPVIITTNPAKPLTSWAKKRFGLWNNFMNAESIIKKYRGGKELGWDIIKTKGYSNFGPAMAVIRLIKKLRYENKRIEL